MLILNSIFDFLTFSFKFLGNSNWAFLILSIFSIFLVLYNRKKVSYKFNLFDTLFFVFILTFLASLYFRQAPFGFVEYSSLFAGYFLYKFFQTIKFNIPKFFYYIFYLINIFTVFHFCSSSFDRLYGLTNFNQTLTTYPNLWALLMGIILILNFQSKRYFLIFSTAIAFFLTLSKTSILSLFLIVILLLFYSFRVLEKNNVCKNVLALFLALIISLGVIELKNTENYTLDRITNQSLSAQSSFNQRFVFFDQSLQMFKSFPFFGVGPGNFKALQPKYANEFYVLSEHPHNLELKILAENGIMSFIVMLAIGIIYLLINLKSLGNPHFLAFMFVLGQSQFDFNLNFTISVLICSYLLANSTKLKLKNFKYSKKIFNILLLQFIIVVLISSNDLVSSKIKNSDFLFLEPKDNQLLAKAYPNYWKFSPSKFSELSPYDNLNLHFDFAPSQSTDYDKLLNQVLDKTKVNFNFLILDDEIPYALKLACYYNLDQIHDDLKLAYTNELGKLNLNQAKQNYENSNCN